MSDSAIPYPSNLIQQQNLLFISTDSTIYVSSTGNDATGNGSVNYPYATLSKAWTIAQTYTIVGNAILYITFLKGTYTFSDSSVPDNLYHPQGSNIIIQGDPTAINQRYLYRVKNYSWDLSNISYYGHTGDVCLTNLDASGSTHGYVATDVNSWVAISNPALSSGGNPFYSYQDITTGVSYGGLDKRDNFGLYGDMFFNHGFSYENVNGILGLAQINVVDAGTTLGLLFKNTNIDARVPAFAPYKKGGISNGLANTLPWAGVANNYPENQFSQPDGYYGSAATNYPAKVAGESANTDQPTLVTSYPVTINKSGTKPVFVIVDGNIRAIRNFMVVTNTFATPSLAVNKSKALNALFPTSEHSPSVTPMRALLQVENGKVGVRHLGVYYAEFGIQAINSEIYTYVECNSSLSPIVAGVQNYTESNYAKLGHADNTPVFNLVNVKYGIDSYKSDIQIGYNPSPISTSGLYTTHYHLSEQGCFIQHSTRGIVLNGESSMVLQSAVINSNRSVPRFSMNLRIPVFAGSTLTTGNTFSMMYPTSWGGSETSPNSNAWQDSSASTGNSYAIGAVVMRCATSPIAGGVTLGYITNISGSGAFAMPTGTYTTTPATATIQYGLGVLIWGYRCGNIEGLSFDFSDSISAGLAAGNTLEFIAFNDNGETNKKSDMFEISKSAIRSTSNANIVTTGVTTGTNAYAFAGYNSNETYVNHVNDASVYITGKSNMRVRKNIIILSADYTGVSVSDQSSLNCVSIDMGTLLPYNATANTTIENGSLLINGAGAFGVSVKRSSYASIGNMFVKHFKPWLKNNNIAPIGTNGCNNGMLNVATQSSAELLDSVNGQVVVFSPFCPTSGLWSSIIGPVATQGSITATPYTTVVGCFDGSVVSRGDLCGTMISAYDGGNVLEQSQNNRPLSFFNIRQSKFLNACENGTTADALFATNTQISTTGHIFSRATVSGAIGSRTSDSNDFKGPKPTSSSYYRWWTCTAGKTAGNLNTYTAKVAWLLPAGYDHLRAASASGSYTIMSGGVGGITYSGLTANTLSRNGTTCIGASDATSYVSEMGNNYLGTR